MMNATVHVPVICLDDDDDDDYLKIDKDYKMFLDHLMADNSLGPLFDLNSKSSFRYEVDNGESETREFDMFPRESKRSVVKNEYRMDSRVSRERKRKRVESKYEISRASSSLVVKKECIQRDNRLAERRKKRAALFAREQDNMQRGTNMLRSKDACLRDVPIVIAQETIQGDNGLKKSVDSNAESLRSAASFRDVPLVIAHKRIRRDLNFSGSKDASLRDVPIDIAQEGIQEDNGVRKIVDLKAEDLTCNQLAKRRKRGNTNNIQQDTDMSESHVESLRDVPVEPETLRRDVPLVRAEKPLQRDEFYVYTSSGVRLVKKRKDTHQDHKVSEKRKNTCSEIEPEMLRRNVPLVRVQEDIQRDNVIAKQRKKEIVETKAARTSKIVPVELKTPRIIQLIEKKKNEEERVAVVNEDYMNYLKWLVDSVKDSETTHAQSDLTPPVAPILEETAIVHENYLLANVKVEQELESWSDDSDIIAVSDTPFTDGEDNTPFVASKCVIDLEEESKEDESRSCLFTKELMDVLKKPYNEKELSELYKEASMQKPVTRCRELRKGREKVYATGNLGPSYLQKSSDFYDQYKLVDGVDKVKALKLLRGFFFYLRNCSRAGAFKPWSKDI